ncbi:MAG: hypothetical protein KGH60_00560 [Candidatus Micrarchaeota archaeon]|nr:hypothetical protein [Candidatus Micrarchaeota archaeon]
MMNRMYMVGHMERDGRAAYAGRLAGRGRLKVNVSLGSVSISQGSPHIVVSGAPGSYKITQAKNEVAISGRGCRMRIRYPKDADIDASVNGGGLSIDGMTPKRLKVRISNGGANIRCVRLPEITADINSESGGVRAMLGFARSAGRSMISIKTRSSAVALGIKAGKSDVIGTKIRQSDSLVRAPRNGYGKILVKVDSADSAVFIGRKTAIPRNIASLVTR